ncbi:hypothetical protein DEDE109153_02280 [Deinococcus deserti]|uniref:Uncharacterized protein n=1 Tax=Deinococcus deserti (strain DSM 17065 / CIP 109153 / LMG 22923 / VCD115) TaxID=546414 RepID=C1CV01_DEIDV|nr:hypothetical protein [Deinococcus deserti]ACO46018.1 Hypothetical protein Deide_11180 [Deinococcus deserti VCD115]
MTKGADLVTLRDAVTVFRGVVMTMGGDVEAVARVSVAGQQDVQAEGWEAPAWAPAGRFRADARMLDAGRPVVERLLIGWRAPDLEAVAAVELEGRELERELYQARAAFIESVALVMCEYAVHGNVYSRHLADGTAWRRVEPGSWPQQAAALLPAAQEALNAFALAWLAVAARVEGAAFLPRRAA